MQLLKNIAGGRPGHTHSVHQLTIPWAAGAAAARCRVRSVHTHLDRLHLHSYLPLAVDIKICNRSMVSIQVSTTESRRSQTECRVLLVSTGNPTLFLSVTHLPAMKGITDSEGNHLGLAKRLTENKKYAYRVARVH